MGIPAYYKKLIGTVSHLVSKEHPHETIDWLFMDYNCLIYHCLRDLPFIHGSDSWESEFISRIIAYTLEVIQAVRPCGGVFIAIDGIVPMAKMRQQRLRRFTSVWMKKQGIPKDGHKKDIKEEKKEKEEKKSWNTNAITPGTEFMKKLRTALERMIVNHQTSTWILSSSDEPGEGEHKIMDAWRRGGFDGNYAVYGLDADLIVLSILGYIDGGQAHPIWLFREDMEHGGFDWFSIGALIGWLIQSIDPSAHRAYLLSYGCAMSILGNDFLPSSFGLKMREEGHVKLLGILQGLFRKGITLVEPDTKEISIEGLHCLFQDLHKREETDLQQTLAKRTKMVKDMTVRHVIPRSVPLGDHYWPLTQMEEMILWHAPSQQLRGDWQQIIMTHFFRLPMVESSYEAICSEYMYGIQWIWAYYMGNDICYNWFYPYSMPPLWGWVNTYMSLHSLPVLEVRIKREEIRPVEQLVLVLPLESWHLIPSCPEKNFPMFAPQYFPSTFSFESAGKMFFWECEPRIPMPTVFDVKALFKS